MICVFYMCLSIIITHLFWIVAKANIVSNSFDRCAWRDGLADGRIGPLAKPADGFDPRP